mgnify:CR=1 FL=1
MDILLSLLKEVREDQKQHGQELAKQSAYLEGMDSDVKGLKDTVSRNTNDISYHIKRTDILEQLHKDNQARINQGEQRLDKLEEPGKAIAWLKKHIITLSGVVAAIVSILAFFLNK